MLNHDAHSFLRITKFVFCLLFFGAVGVLLPDTLSLSAQENHLYDVSPTAITVPAVSVTRVSFTGSPVSITIPANDAYVVTSESAIDVGQYQATLSLITPASYTWEDETTEDKTIAWEIIPKSVVIPSVLITQSSFTGSPVSITISANEAYVVTSETAIGVGQYQARLSLITPASYIWEDATTEDQLIDWEIIPKTISRPAVGITQFAFSSFDNTPDIYAYPGSQSFSHVQSQVGIYTWTIELVDSLNTRFENTTQTAFDFTWEITPMIVSVPAIGVTEYAFTGFLNRPEVSPFPGSEATGEMVSQVGIHTYTVELFDPPNMRFSNGTNAAFLVPWSITRAVVTVPSIIATRFAFTGDMNRPGLEISPGSEGSPELVSEVGIHSYSVTLLDPINTIFSNGTTSAFTVTWEIFPLTAITKPSIGVTSYGFTGFLNRPEVILYDETSLTGTTIASEAGIYTAYARVNYPDQIQFQDGTTEVAIEWEITPMIVSKPAVALTSFAFGNVIHEVGAFIGPGSTMTHATAVSVGAYTATVSLDYPRSQTWPDGTTDPIDIPWEINEIVVSLPAILVTQYAFQGADNYPALEVYPGSESTGQAASQVGVYVYTVALIDPENSKFSNGSKDPVEITWEITPLVVSVPAVLVTQFAFNGSDNYPGVTVYPGSEATSELASQVGIHTYTIELQDTDNLIFSNGSTDPIEIIWEITPMRVEKPEIQVTSFAFTGDVLGPPTFSAPIKRDPISSTDVGIYTVRYSTTDGDNITFDDGSTEFLIEYEITQREIDASNWSWDYDEVLSFTGDVQTVELLNVPEFIEINYENHQASQSGIYNARARFVYDTTRITIMNPPASLEWEIFQKTSIPIPTPLSERLTFDGTPQIPSFPSIQGVSISVSAQTVPGEYRYSFILNDPRQTEWNDGTVLPITYPFYIEKRVIDLSMVDLSKNQFVPPEFSLELLNMPDFVDATWTFETTPGKYQLDVEWVYDDSLVEIINVPSLSYTVLPETLTVSSLESPIEVIANEAIVFSPVSQSDSLEALETMLQEESFVSETIQVYSWDITDSTLEVDLMTIYLQRPSDYAIYDGEMWQLLTSDEPINLERTELIAELTLEPAQSNWAVWAILSALPVILGGVLFYLKRK